MDRPSIDGRRRKKTEQKGKTASSSATSSRTSQAPAKLRPASPPSTNPWACPQRTSVASQDFPPLPSATSSEPKAQRADTTSSRASSTSSCPPTGDVSQVVPTACSISTCSDSSRHILEAAASRATESLWKRPFGADVVVHTDTMTFEVHRNIVEPESGWFRDNLPPPNPDGSPVKVYLACATEAAAFCLRFIYTGRVEICDIDSAHPWNSIHLPRCVLGYCAAAFLRVSKMAAHLLRIVEKTSAELATLVTTDYLHRNLNDSELMDFSWHFQNALDILYNERCHHLMMPMRLAMAGLLDATLFWLVRQPGFIHLLQTTWQRFPQTILLDQAEYRRLVKQRNGTTKSPVPNEAALEKLFGNGKSREVIVDAEVVDSSPSRTALSSRGRAQTWCRRPRGSSL
ncbi:hypothetical protein B0J13DRAFT_601818 [Dactylonectria estremocensis]|uniref:BTB domain-containing protein n=1 Tax=Dactylonectria estremocensis TaxID=1079267 RepID=A0A9P9FJ94_9HYPO|nr:hypothetical protein B0J13DRAFT_601818 [Dactylonectria estremocensis]